MLCNWRRLDVRPTLSATSRPEIRSMTSLSFVFQRGLATSSKSRRLAFWSNSGIGRPVLEAGTAHYAPIAPTAREGTSDPPPTASAEWPSGDQRQGIRSPPLRCRGDCRRLWEARWSGPIARSRTTTLSVAAPPAAAITLIYVKLRSTNPCVTLCHKGDRCAVTRGSRRDYLHRCCLRPQGGAVTASELFKCQQSRRWRRGT